MRKILEACPSCGSPLVVTELQCPQCQTQVRSQYSPCAFCALTEEQLVFVKLFVEKRGNLREMEKVLGISYPTVRSKLEEIAERLEVTGAPVEGLPRAPVVADPAHEQRREILLLISKGELSPRDGLAYLRGEQPPGELARRLARHLLRGDPLVDEDVEERPPAES